MKPFALSLLVLLTICCSVVAQNAADKSAIKKAKPDSAVSTKTAEQQELDAILDELKAIRQLLADQNKYINARGTAAAPQQPVEEKVKLKVTPGWYSIGRDDAPVTIVEFSDYQCPFCQKFHKEAFAQIKKDYIDTGKVRFVSRDLPLEFHPFSHPAATAARCAGEQGKFWEMRDVLINHASDLKDESILGYAGALNLNVATMTSCMKADKFKDALAADSAEAAKLSISGTPSFVIARSNTEELDGNRVVGALPYATFQGMLDEMLKPPAAPPAKAAENDSKAGAMPSRAGGN